MSSRFWTLFAGTCCLGLLVLSQTSARPDQPPPRPSGADTAPQEGVDVQARGPVHEAFAEPAQTRPEQTPLVKRRPPDPVAEDPPDQKPEGDNVAWIPGYWAYDEDRDDFLWVSGFWRDEPPGHQWVPGTWEQVDGGYHWVAGYWATQDQQQVEYLPAPPTTLDRGPTTPEPSEPSSYVPGCWVYRETRYLWRPGFWVPYRPDWCWVPAHYVWTTCGYIFVDGYWDRPLHRRGLLFAPVRFSESVIAEERFVYVPRFVVQTDFLLGALFIQPVTCHYYFGDFFEDRYTRRGFVPWCDYRVGRSVYDANFAYYRTAFAGEPGWERGLRDLYGARFDGTVPPPPRTLVQQNQVINNITVNKTVNNFVTNNINVTNVQNVSALTPLTRVADTPMTSLAALAVPRADLDPRNLAGSLRDLRVDRGVFTPAPRLAPLAGEDLSRQRESVRQLRDVAQERNKIQTRLLSEGGVPSRPTDKPKTVQLRLPTMTGRPAVPTRGTERPGETRPGVTPRPGDTRPAGPRPGERPGVAPRPGEPRPGETRPVEPRPGDRPAVTPRPGDTRPVEPRPGETRPGERPGVTPRPVEPRPGETRPGERPGVTPRPGDTRPVEPRPGDRPAVTPRPGDTRPVEPRPGTAPRPPERPVPPPLPRVPQHEERPIPQHEAPNLPKPPTSPPAQLRREPPPREPDRRPSPPPAAAPRPEPPRAAPPPAAAPRPEPPRASPPPPREAPRPGAAPAPAPPRTPPPAPPKKEEPPKKEGPPK